MKFKNKISQKWANQFSKNERNQRDLLACVCLEVHDCVFYLLELLWSPSLSSGTKSPSLSDYSCAENSTIPTPARGKNNLHKLCNSVALTVIIILQCFIHFFTVLVKRLMLTVSFQAQYLTWSSIVKTHENQGLRLNDWESRRVTSLACLRK